MPGSNLANVGQTAKGVGKRVLCDLTLTVVAFDALRLAQTAGHIFVAASLLSATRVACLHVRGEAIRRAWPSVNTMSSRYLASNEIALFLARSFALSAVVFCRIHIHSSDVSSHGCVTARRITRPGVIVYSGWELHSRDSPAWDPSAAKCCLRSGVVIMRGLHKKESTAGETTMSPEYPTSTSSMSRDGRVDGALVAGKTPIL